MLATTTGSVAPATYSAHMSPRAANATDAVTVIAHRGASAAAPENTLPAVILGAESNADYVEIDLQMTRDGELVVIHDTTLVRTTDVEGRYPDRAPWNVRDLTLAEIRTLDAGFRSGEQFTGTTVPTLQEVLRALRGRAGLLLEVKSPALYPGITEAIVAELDGEGWLSRGAGAQRLVVQSFDWTFMRKFSALAPEVPAGLLAGSPSEARIAELSTWAAQINPDHQRVTAELVNAVQHMGWPCGPTRPMTRSECGSLSTSASTGSSPTAPTCSSTW